MRASPRDARISVTPLPPSSRGLPLRRRIYAGDIVLAPAGTATARLADDVGALLDAVFGSELRDPCTAERDDFWWKVSYVRKALAHEELFRSHAAHLAAELGFHPERTAFEPFRLRAVLDRGHLVPRNASAYVVHRDTWYAHPSSAIAAWIPIFDVSAEETFRFFPSCFTRPIHPNDSEQFTYKLGAAVALDREVAEVHHLSNRIATLPHDVSDVAFGPELGFAARRGDTLLFSAAHLHYTLPQESKRTRFSVDCRFVSLDDHEGGLGAPNVDNVSRGSALTDYARFPLKAGESLQVTPDA